jgi:nucleotide-binding universal stress UspA family protein
MVPLDGSDFSTRALPLAVALAQRALGVLELVHVHEAPQRTVGGHVLSPRLDDEERRIMRHGLTRLAADTIRASRVAVIPRFLEGEVVSTLEQHAYDSGAELIVMTTHGRGGVSRLLFGSVTENLVRDAHVPILLVRPEPAQVASPPEPHFRRILVPLEHSRVAEEILPHAVAFATPGKTELVLLSIVDLRLAIGPTAVDLRLDVGSRESLLDNVVRTAEQRLARLAAKLRTSGIAVKTEVVADAFPAQCILNRSQSYGVDLIAFTTHARRALGRLLLGAIADKIIRGAHCPTLVLHPHASPPGVEEKTPEGAELRNRTPAHV